MQRRLNAFAIPGRPDTIVQRTFHSPVPRFTAGEPDGKRIIAGKHDIRHSGGLGGHLPCDAFRRCAAVAPLAVFRVFQRKGHGVAAYLRCRSSPTYGHIVSKKAIKRGGQYPAVVNGVFLDRRRSETIRFPSSAASGDPRHSGDYHVLDNVFRDKCGWLVYRQLSHNLSRRCAVCVVAVGEIRADAFPRQQCAACPFSVGFSASGDVIVFDGDEIVLYFANSYGSAQRGIVHLPALRHR